AKPTFWSKVPVGIPGVEKPAMLNIEFKHKTRDELKDFCLKLKEREDAESLKEIVVGWKDVDEEYSHDTLDTLLDNFPSASLSMIETYIKEAVEAKGKT